MGSKAAGKEGNMFMPSSRWKKTGNGDIGQIDGERVYLIADNQAERWSVTGNGKIRRNAAGYHRARPF